MYILLTHSHECMYAWCAFVCVGHWQHSTLMVTAGWGLRGLVGALTADLSGSGVTVQEVVLPYLQDESEKAVESAALQNSADIVDAIELRLPLVFAGSERTGGGERQRQKRGRRRAGGVHPTSLPLVLNKP